LYGGSTSLAGESSGTDGGDVFSDTASSFTNTYGGGIDGSAKGSVLASVAATVVGSGYSSSEGGPDAVIEIFFHNETPYMRTEKRASTVYAVVHKESAASQYPVVMARTPACVNSAAMLFEGKGRDSASDKLSMLEQLLKDCLL
jgi:hypothetical protein